MLNRASLSVMRLAAAASAVLQSLTYRSFRGATPERKRKSSRYSNVSDAMRGQPGVKLARLAEKGMVTRRWPGLAPKMPGRFPFSNKRKG